MTREERLRIKAGKDTGFRVPDGYFDQTYAKVMASLPERKAIPETKVSLWTRVRPYVYLAAMFAGIWCMMRIFHDMSGQSSTVSLDNPPAAVAQAMTEAMSEPVQADYIAHADISVSTPEIEKNVTEKYSQDFDQFVDDFGYELQPEYNSIDVPERLLDAADQQTDLEESYAYDYTDYE